MKGKSTPSKANVARLDSKESIILQLLLKFSSFNKITKIVAWLLRPVKIIKRPVVKLSILPISPFANNITIDKKPNQEIKQDNERKTRSKSNSKLISVVMSLIFFMSLITSSQAAFKISALPNNNSLYFETVGNMQVIRDKWNLIVYYDMSPYWEGNTAAKKFLDYLQRLCVSLNDTSKCDMITLQLNHDYKEIQHYNQLMINQHFDARTRQRRGLINGIGYVANSLFGVLDERFAEQYKKDIQLVKQNERHLDNLIKNQTSIIEAEYNVLKRTEQTIQLQHKTINKHLNQLDNAAFVMKQELDSLAKTQEFALSALTTINLLQNLKRIQDTLLDIVTDIYHGKFNTHLLTPDQLQHELQFISGQLTKDTTLPVDNLQSDLKNVYSMLKVKARMMQEYFIFEITFPLTSRDSYTIYKITPVPRQVQNYMISVLPADDYVAISLKKDAFFTISFIELQLCLHNDKSYLCQVNRQINHLRIDEKFCKLDSNLKQCIVIKSPCQDRWLELNEPTKFMYFCCNTYAVRIICQDQVAFKQVTGVGIIDLDSKCIIKSNEFTLYAHALSSNIIKSNSEIVTPQIAELNHIVNISLSPYIAYEDPINSTLEDLGKRIKQLKSANTNSLDYTLSTHDIHQYTICYCLLGLAVLAAAYFIWRRCQTVSSVELPQSVANSVVFSRKQSTADRQPSEVNITSANTDCKRDIATSPRSRKCSFRLEDV
uniref:Envelope fusion protein n=1 Tax=Heliothis virescens TaxID=7102 RepID=A0A2A4JSD5_HELVI